MARKPQRMVQGYNSCLNLNNWNHLFSPNSESAQQGALNCFDYWNRVAPPGNGMERTGKIEMVRYSDFNVKVDPDQKLAEKLILVGLAITLLWFFIIRK